MDKDAKYLSESKCLILYEFYFMHRTKIDLHGGACL